MNRWHRHTEPPPGGAPATTSRAVRDMCWLGIWPADDLSRADRERLIEDLWDQGWSDVEIATHTRMSTYTTWRIRTRLGLAPHQQKEAAA